MKKYFLISGFNLEDSNRGTAALSYGSISFLEERKYLLKKHTLINYHIYNNPFKANNRKVHYNYIEIETKFLFCSGKAYLTFSGFT